MRVRLSAGARAAAAAVVAACMAVSLGGGARAQVGGDPTTTTSTIATTTTEPPPSTTTTTEPTTTSTSTSTTAPPSDDLPTTTAPGTTTTTRPDATTTTRPAPPVVTPPAIGGDSAPPPGTAPEIPAALQAKINSVRRSGPNSTAPLIAALAPLVAMGMTEQEAIQAGFGRFPVGGRATFTHDWWFLRFVPELHLHEGTDIFAAYGTPARAPASGTLRQTFSPVGGLSAYVTEADGTYYYLAHLSRFEPGQVSGQAVEAGDVIGYVGDSGNARGTSPHVHFEIHPDGGGPTDPKRFLDAWLDEALAAVPSVVAAAAPTPAGPGRTPTEEQDLTVVGHTDRGGRGGYGDVAVVGHTALVAAGDGAPRPVPAAAVDPLATVAAGPTCEASVAVVDLRDPAVPVVAATIALAPGERVEDLDTLAVRTPGFTGDLAAVAAGPCSPGDGGTGVAFYDVSDASDPQLLGRVVHPRRLADGADTGCGAVLRGTCARSDRTVDLQQLADGRVVSLSRAPAVTDEAGAEAFVVDLSVPAKPRALGFVPLGGPEQTLAVDDGCSPVRLPQNRRAPAGRLGPLLDITGSSLATQDRPTDEVSLDAGAGYRTVAEGGGRRLALAPEGAFWSSTWALRVDAPAEAAGEKPGCARPLAGGAGPTAGALVYVGRGCPGRQDVDGTLIPPDPYLGDPAGRIAVADAALAPAQQSLSGQGCTPADRLGRARQAGALGLVVAGSFLADVADAAPGADP
ncbi:MAG: peptidoglycan DD-metalloendopeptidase family protein, partial [Acidimicrobiales bacterium]